MALATVSAVSSHEAFRRLEGLSVTELAERVGVSHSYVSRVEKGHIPASERYIAAVARVLDVDRDLVFLADGRTFGMWWHVDGC